MTQHRCVKIEISGVVQGVGFRPFALKSAASLSLKGLVKNYCGGALIELCGDEVSIELFIEKLKNKAPPLAKIDKINITDIGFKEFDSFVVAKSDEGAKALSFFPPDLTICKECEEELFCKDDKRFMYPLVNCQNCGPRFTVIESLPYDRERTSMRPFEMCPSCKKEYEDPNDRRFHAEPISCPSCGPSFYFTSEGGEVLDSSKDGKILSLVAAKLTEGKTIALKGVGGFHLICRADSDEAIARLRERKRRERKPLAVMFKNLKELKKECSPSPKEEEIVCSNERPITLLKKSKNYSLSPLISFESAFIGVFLPYNGIYQTLFSLIDFPIVATSANISDEPIITDEKELFCKLYGTFDYAFYYDRKIVQGCDDSVVRVSGNTLIKIRNSRGFAPVFLKAPIIFPKALFCAGAHQKNTFAICLQDNIAISPHIGDLNSLEALGYYEKSVERLRALWGAHFELTAHDANSRYASSSFALSLGVPSLPVWHHLAHFYASLLEHNALFEDALGVVWDGTGLGEDGAAWGGEFFEKRGEVTTRVEHLPYFWLLGGEKSAKEPKKTALSLALSFMDKKEALTVAQKLGFSKEEIDLLLLAWDRKLNCIKSSSMGRLFDAAAAILGLVGEGSYEGESGLMLESLYDYEEAGFYDVFMGKNIDLAKMLNYLLNEKDTAKAASKFINTLAVYVKIVCQNQNLPIFFSGGVFQNAALVSAIKKAAPNERLFFCEKLSPNDSSICAGQAAFLIDVIRKHEQTPYLRQGLFAPTTSLC